MGEWHGAAQRLAWKQLLDLFQHPLVDSIDMDPVLTPLRRTSPTAAGLTLSGSHGSRLSFHWRLPVKVATLGGKALTAPSKKPRSAARGFMRPTTRTTPPPSHFLNDLRLSRTGSASHSTGPRHPIPLCSDTGFSRIRHPQRIKGLP